MKNNYKNIILYTIGIIILLLIIELLSLIINNNILFPSIFTIIKEFFIILTINSTYIYILHTLIRLIISLSISFIIGSLIGILAGVSNSFKIIITPLITLLKCIPVIIILLILLLFTNNEYASIITTILILIPIIYESILSGVLSIDKRLIDVYRLESNFNLKVLSKVHYKLVIAHARGGLSSSLGIGIKALVTIEYISGIKSGIGKSIINSISNIEYARLYAYTLLLIIILLIVDILIKVIFSLRKY